MIVLHGENRVGSRRQLQEIKDQRSKIGDEIVVLEGSKVSLTEVKQAIEATSLFGGGRLVVIEGLFSGKVSKNQKEVIKYLSGSKDSNLVIWEGKKLTATVLKSVGGEERESKVSAQIFVLMDCLKPGNTSEVLRAWEASLQQEETEMIFYMLCRQVRLLIQAKTDPHSLKGNLYMVRKLSQQVGAFEQEQLLTLHEKLYLIDKAQKTGATPLPLAEQVEQWLLEI